MNVYSDILQILVIIIITLPIYSSQVSNIKYIKPILSEGDKRIIDIQYILY